MPIWLRNFTYQKIAEFKQKESEAYKGKSSSKGNTNTIDFANPDKSKIPSYVTKASKK